jgi:O-acetyl-ADP-ribose deacetylase
VAFPSISTGVYGFPIDRAAPIAVDEVRRFVAAPTSLTEVTFCCFSPADLAVYQRVLAASK